MKKYLNHLNTLIIILSFFNFSYQSDKFDYLEANVGDAITETISTDVKYRPVVYLSANGSFYLELDFIDEKDIFDPYDIEDKTSFKTSFYVSYYYNRYYITCRLWKPSGNKLFLICHMDTYFDYADKNVNIEQALFYYKNYRILIYFQNLHIYKLSSPSPFLYYGIQTITIQEDKRLYELEFMIEEYNNELLYLFSNDNYIYLDNCLKYDRYLVCEIKKEDIEEVLRYNEQKFDVYSYNDKLGLYRMDLINNITIIDNIKEKQEVLVKELKLLTQYIGKNNYIAYETNIASISNVVTAKFNVRIDNIDKNCYFKKEGENPLLLLCKWDYSNQKNKLGKIENEIILENINIKYTFKIQSLDEENVFYFEDDSSTVFYNYPKVLNFSLNNNNIIYYVMEYPSDEKKIKLFSDSEDLDCKDLNSKIKACYINIDYFKNKASGYYYTSHYLTYYHNYSIIYEFSPIQVIMPNNPIFMEIIKDENTLKIGQKGTLYFVTDYKDNEHNIFNSIDSDTITFSLNFIKYDNEELIKAECRFWKPNNNQNIRLICSFDDIFKNDFKITLYDKIEYNNYTFIISLKEYITVTQLNYYIPFLYSEERTINVEGEKQDYSLSFKIVSYDNEDLFIYGSKLVSTNVINYAKLDNCEVNGNTLNCKISKLKLEEILTKKTESFRIMTTNNNDNIIELEYIGLITINCNVIKKEDIYVGITKVLNNVSEAEIPIAFETNVTSIQNLTSLTSATFKIRDDDNERCYFKKTKINHLLLLCFYKNYYPTPIRILEEEKVINDAHYKYNFRIQPYNISSNTQVYSSGSGIYLTDPEELKFSLQTPITVRFITETPYYVGNIALLYSDSKSYTKINYLECENKNKMKKCKVPISYFIKQNYKENTNSYIYPSHFYSYNELITDYEVAPILVTLPDKMIVINVINNENSDTKIICNNAMIYLITDYDDSNNIFDSSDIEEKTLFNTSFKTVNNNNYNITCRLWKSNKKNIFILCQTNNDLFFSYEQIIQGDIQETIFHYNDYSVVLISDNLLKFEYQNGSCPFLYSDEQIINVNQNNDNYYDLKFKIGSYNGEPLFLSNIDINYINLNCSEENSNLNCKLPKDKLLEQNNEQTFKLYFLNNIYGFQETGLILDIIVNSDIQKENINVKITNLLQNYIEFNNYVAYETDVTGVSNLISDYFLIDSSRPINCFLRKTNLNNLLVLCRWTDFEDYYLGEIKKEIVLNNIHIKYNFRIQPVKNTKKFKAPYKGSWALFIYPQELYFYKNNTNTFDIYMHKQDYTDKIILNNNSLSCDGFSSSSPQFKRCTINKGFFTDLSGDQYYYIQHKGDNSNVGMIFYELPPIVIKFPKSNEIVININEGDNENSLNIGKSGVLYLTTNYFDSENIFNYNDIEQNTVFYSKIQDNFKNKYNVKCRLWKTQNNNIKLICKLNRNLKYSSQSIILEDIKFNYKDYIIYIFTLSEIEVNQLDYSIPFIYSDVQNININGDNHDKFYNLVFKYESYNNDLLYE